MSAYELPWDHDGIDLLVQVQLQDEGMRVLSVSEALTGEERPDLLTAAEQDDTLFLAACEIAPDERALCRTHDCADAGVRADDRDGFCRGCHAARAEDAAETQRDLAREWRDE